MTTRSLTLLMGLGLAGIAACGDDPVEPVLETLALDFTGLEPLANGYHYEGWAIIGGAPVTTGKFNIGAANELVTTTGAPIAGGTFATQVDLDRQLGPELAPQLFPQRH